MFVLGGVVFSFNRTCMPLWATDCGVVCLGDVRCKTNTKHQIDAIPPRAAVRVGLRICVGRTSRRRCRDYKLLPDAIFAHHKNSGMSDVPLTTLVELLAEVRLETWAGSTSSTVATEAVV